MLKVKRAILDQMQLGLEGQQGGLMMLPSFVDAFPSSLQASRKEQTYFAIDLGGTSLKIVRIKIQNGELRDVQKREWPIPDECYDTDNGRLLAWIATSFVEFARVKRAVIGFCYSFACRQDNLDHGEQIMWTKRFKGTGLLGVDVVQALRDEFRKRAIDVVIPALMNDSVASLVGAQFADPRVQASVILGTGTNCSYIEHVENIKTLPKVYRKRSDRMIVNTEWGDCSLPRSLGITVEEDKAVDVSSANPGHGLFEKLISGLYIGDVARRILLRMASNFGLFEGKGLPIPQGTFDGAAVSRMFSDNSEDLADVHELLRERFGVMHSTKEERRIAKDVCVMIATRSARLCAAAMVAIASREVSAGACPPDSSPDRETAAAPIVISVDGSTFTKFVGYKALVEAAIDELRDADISGSEPLPPIEILVADGASVSGAAICAAVFTHFT